MSGRRKIDRLIIGRRNGPLWWPFQLWGTVHSAAGLGGDVCLNRRGLKPVSGHRDTGAVNRAQVWLLLVFAYFYRALNICAHFSERKFWYICTSVTWRFQSNSFKEAQTWKKTVGHRTQMTHFIFSKKLEANMLFGETIVTCLRFSVLLPLWLRLVSSFWGARSTNRLSLTALAIVSRPLSGQVSHHFLLKSN